jgi:hypothetical protein
VFACEGVGELTGPVRRVVVDHEDLHVWHGQEQADQDRQVVALVVRGDDDEWSGRKVHVRDSISTTAL